MKRILLTVVAVGSLTFSVFIFSGGNVTQQTNALADAGITPTHVATCPVRISPELQDDSRAAGVNVRTYERLTFPVSVRVLPDAGREVQLPPIRQDAREGIQPDWPNCTLALCSTRPALCAKWGTPLPLALETRSARCARKNVAGGKATCALTDGGDPGDMNIYPAARFGNVALCESVEGIGPACAVVLGDNPNTEL